MNYQCKELSQIKLYDIEYKWMENFQIPWHISISSWLYDSQTIQTWQNFLEISRQYLALA